MSGTKYLYIRKRIAGKLTSTYVDVYSDELYQLLLRNAKERKDLNKSIRKINKELVEGTTKLIHSRARQMGYAVEQVKKGKEIQLVLVRMQ